MKTKWKVNEHVHVSIRNRVPCDANRIMLGMTKWILSLLKRDTVVTGWIDALVTRVTSTLVTNITLSYSTTEWSNFRTAPSESGTIRALKVSTTRTYIISMKLIIKGRQQWNFKFCDFQQNTKICLNMSRLYFIFDKVAQFIFLQLYELSVSKTIMTDPQRNWDDCCQVKLLECFFKILF